MMSQNLILIYIEDVGFKAKPQLVESYSKIMNEEWPRNLKKEDKIQRHCSNKDGFPYHLVITTSFTTNK